MIIKTTKHSLQNIASEIIILPLAKENKVPKEITKYVKTKDFNADLNNLSLLYTELKTKRILLAGLGKEKEITLEKIRSLISTATKTIQQLKLVNLSILLPKVKILSQEKIAEAILESVLLTNYQFDKYKTKKEIKEIKNINLIADISLDKIIARTKIICSNVNFVRDLVNESSDVINPITLTNKAKEIAKNNKLKITILDENKLKKLNMNLILAVSSGSRYPPRLVILEYKNSNTKKKIALIGKGVTFDTGGINLKPPGYIETMRLDKAGAATVLGIIKTASELKLKTNIIALLPLVENMISPNSYKPGDIITSYSKKTVEIGNTDAEGRLILADTLAYAEKNIKPSVMIDLATLTSSIIGTFSNYITGFFTNNEKLAKQLFDKGQETHEMVWQLPIYDEYSEENKSEIADIKNIGGKYAGAIAGAAFLKSFIKNTSWIHLDIAGSAWYEKEKDYIPKNATGIGLRLLISFIEDIKD